MTQNQNLHAEQVYTSDLRGAGTDARVFIRLEGQGGRDSGPLRLENSKNNFERGAQVRQCTHR